MSNSRVPRTIVEFNGYIGITTNHLNAGEPKNAERLGVTEEELTTWTGIYSRWTPLYVLYSDKPNSRTLAVTAQLQALMDECYTFNQTKHILDRIAASPNVTVVDLQTFNIMTGTAKRSYTVQPIQESVITSIQLLGGGSVTVKCHANGSIRASIIDPADCVEFVYAVGTTPPESADAAGLNKGSSTKATFTLALGSGSSSKYLYIYFR